MMWFEKKYAFPEPFNPSTNLLHAWMVIEHESYFEHIRGERGNWNCAFEKGDATRETVTHAICLAYLLDQPEIIKDIDTETGKIKMKRYRAS
jgi:hypothetical protein